MEKNEELPIVEHKLNYYMHGLVYIKSSVRLCSSTKLLIETGEIV